MNTFLNTVQIHDVSIPLIEFKDERVLPFKLIDQVHERSEGTALRNFKSNRERFIENEDFFAVSRDEFRPEIWENFGFHTKAPNGFLITETGYLMLVKSFTDDLAWKVQRELVRHYFRAKPAAGKITPKEYRYIRSRVSNLVLRMAATNDAMARKTLWEEIQELCAVIEAPLPNLALLGKDARQMVLPGFESAGGAS